MTVRGLLRALSAAGVELRADGPRLWTAGPMPDGLLPALRLLHTGIRAHLAGVPWFGCDGLTGRVCRLDLRATIPPEVTLLCAEGDARWDRISVSARQETPGVFGGIGGVGQMRSDRPAGEH